MPSCQSLWSRGKAHGCDLSLELRWLAKFNLTNVHKSGLQYYNCSTSPFSSQSLSICFLSLNIHPSLQVLAMFNWYSSPVMSIKDDMIHTRRTWGSAYATRLRYFPEASFAHLVQYSVSKCPCGINPGVILCDQFRKRSTYVHLCNHYHVYASKLYELT